MFVNKNRPSLKQSLSQFNFLCTSVESHITNMLFSCCTIAIFKNSAYQNGIFAICSLRMLLVH